MYILQFQKTDTLASQLNSGDTSGTLTTGSFGSPSGTQLLVVDYDVPAKREVISCAISSTALTSVSRGLDGTSAVTHSATANVIMAFVPSHYANGLGAIAANDGWTTWSPTYSASGSMTYLSVSTSVAKYQQIGKTVHFRISATGTTGGSASPDLQFTLPVTAADANWANGCRVNEGTSNVGLAFMNSATIMNVEKYDSSNWTLSSGKFLSVSGSYQAA